MINLQLIFLEQDSNSFLTQVLLTIILNWRPDSTSIISDSPTYFCVLILSSECQHIQLPLLQKVGKKCDFLPTPRHYLCLHLLWNRSIKCTKELYLKALEIDQDQIPLLQQLTQSLRVIFAYTSAIYLPIPSMKSLNKKGIYVRSCIW